MPVPSPLLLDEDSARKALSLDQDDLAWLVATGQLTPITIAGHRQYLYRQLEELVRVYRSKQVGANHES
jgi:hypothetical protein